MLQILLLCLLAASALSAEPEGRHTKQPFGQLKGSLTAATEKPPTNDGYPELSWIAPDTIDFDCGNAAVMAWLSQLSYAQKAGGAPDLETIKTEIAKWWPNVQVEPIHERPVEGFILKDGKKAIVIFRGSDAPVPEKDGVEDWLTNGQAVFTGVGTVGYGRDQRPAKPNGPPMKYETHAGFYSLFDQVHKKRIVSEQLKGYEDKPVFFGGHSLGGAIATLIARQFHEDGYKKVQLYTMGAPRPGSVAMNNYFVTNNIPAYRVEHGWDPVPGLPDLRFHAVGKLVQIYRDEDGQCQVRSQNKVTEIARQFSSKLAIGFTVGNHSSIQYSNCLMRLKREGCAKK